MTKRLISSTLAIAICVQSTGCQKGRMISEYHPGSATTTRTVMDAGVFSLWKTAASQHRVRSNETEVTEVYIHSGDPIGFSREGQALLCITGTTKIPLTEASYRWRVAQLDNPSQPPDPVEIFVRDTATVALVIVLLPVVLYLYLLNPDSTDTDSPDGEQSRQRSPVSHNPKHVPVHPKQPASRP